MKHLSASPLNKTPYLAISGYSNHGKTTLIEYLVTSFCRAGQSCGVIKHTHHRGDAEDQFKDTGRYRAAGAAAVALLTDHELPHGQTFDQVVLSRAFQTVECEIPALVLLEGFKHAPIPKIWVHRSELGPLDVKDIPLIEAVYAPGTTGQALLPATPQFSEPEPLLAWLVAWLDRA